MPDRKLPADVLSRAYSERVIPHSHACPKQSGGKHDPTVCAADGGLGYKPREIPGLMRQREDGSWRFPTLSKCLVCEGYTSVLRTGEERFEPEEATRVALLQHGYLLAKWERMNVANATIIPHPCRCGHLHSWKPASAPVVGDNQFRLAPANMIKCEFCKVERGAPDSSD